MHPRSSKSLEEGASSMSFCISLQRHHSTSQLLRLEGSKVNHGRKQSNWYRVFGHSLTLWSPCKNTSSLISEPGANPESLQPFTISQDIAGHRSCWTALHEPLRFHYILSSYIAISTEEIHQSPTKASKTIIRPMTGSKICP